METENVMSKDVALKELEIIQDIFDVVYDEADREKILPAIMAGRFITDEAAETVLYNFIKPVSQKNGETRDTITFKAPSVTDMEYVNKGFTIKVDTHGDTIMDMGMMQSRTNRAVIKLSGWPTGLIERISRKDMRIFSGLFNFFD